MILDIRTLIITDFLYTLIIGVIFAISYNNFSGQVRSSIKTLSNGMFIMAVGWIFLGLRGIIPDFHSIVWGNLASVLGLAELTNTIRVFDGKTTKRRFLYPLAILFILLNTYYYLVNDLPSVRISIISLSTAVFSLLIAFTVFYKPIYKSNIRIWAGYAFILFSLISLFRGIDSLFVNFGKYTLLSNTPLQTYYLVSIFLAIFLISFSFILMCTHRFSDELNKHAIIDPITNLYNRNGIRLYLQKEIQECVKNNQPLCVVVFDINEFRKFNDQYGLESGDKALLTMGATILSNIGYDHITGRLGGDEFVLILPETNLSAGIKIAEKISSDIEKKSIVFNNQQLSMTISCGVAALDPEFPDSNLLIKNAHHELFKARTLSDDSYGT